jgi:hypothetical protein
VAIQREIGDRRGQAASLDSLGKALCETGDRDEARQSWTEAQEIFEDIGDPRAAEVSARLERLDATAS